MSTNVRLNALSRNFKVDINTQYTDKGNAAHLLLRENLMIFFVNMYLFKKNFVKSEKATFVEMLFSTYLHSFSSALNLMPYSFQKFVKITSVYKCVVSANLLYLLSIKSKGELRGWW